MNPAMCDPVMVPHSAPRQVVWPEFAPNSNSLPTPKASTATNRALSPIYQNARGAKVCGVFNGITGAPSSAGVARDHKIPGASAQESGSHFEGNWRPLSERGRSAVVCGRSRDAGFAAGQTCRLDHPREYADGTDRAAQAVADARHRRRKKPVEEPARGFAPA